MTTLPFSDLVEINPRTELARSEEHPFVEMGAIEPGRRYVHANQRRTLQSGGARFMPGDTLFARITPCLENGKIAQYESVGDEAGFGSTEFLVFRARPEVADPGYVYCLSRSDLIRKPAERSMSGASGRQRADAKAVAGIRVPAPVLSTQRKIAAVLTSYDDLIETNMRRIMVLEGMAQDLYHEWFVKFRFPGHERLGFIDSPLGEVPLAWPIGAVREAVVISPTLPVAKHEKVPFVPMGSLSETSMLIGEIEYRSETSGSRFQNGDTLFARITPCLENGKTAYVQFLESNEAVACGSTEFIVLRSKTLCPEYVYLMARSRPFRDNAIKSMSGASGRQRVSEGCFDKFLLAQPPEALLERFQNITRPQFQMIHLLNSRNQVLRRTRDLLLPPLISGELDVSTLDIAVPEEPMA